MPIYEFLCPACNRIFNFLARGPSDTAKTPVCPKCGGEDMRRQLSSFAVSRASARGRGGSEDSDAGPEGRPAEASGMDDARMDRAMSTLEGEMAGFDEENPDPRQLGRFMRRMADLTGEKLPSELQEAVRRLEAGEDPEKIEKDMGDSLGGGEGESGGPGGAPPSHDEGLYGM